MSTRLRLAYRTFEPFAQAYAAQAAAYQALRQSLGVS